MHLLFRNFKVRIFTKILFISLIAFSCRKLVGIKAPVTSVNQQNVYSVDATAISVLTGLYYNMCTDSYFTGNGGSNGSISLAAGLSADELNLWDGISTTDARYYYFTNSLFANTPGTNPGSEFWGLYGGNYIYTCNAAIEGLNASGVLTPSVKQQLLGEAKFMRAFFYFYLVNLYGDVPLITTTDWQINASLPCTSKAQVYQQIINDLKDAQSLLSINYLDNNLQPYPGSPERVRPTKGAATALLARVYLNSGDFPNAETQATDVINNTTFYSLTSLNNVFLKNSNESIWQLQPVASGYNTQDAKTFVLPATGPDDEHPVYLSSFLVNSFEANDQRKVNWVDSITQTPPGTLTYYFPYKYKSNNKNDAITTPADMDEYLMVLRLGEQYLIRAEARVQQNNIGGAQSDLNMIRTRAGLGNTIANDRTSLLAAILHERQVELFTEWGQRWLDLKRTNNVDAVMSVVTPLKANGAVWKSYQQLYPLPLDDIQKDGNLVQNTGY